MQITKRYSKDFVGNLQRKQAEKKLFAEGYKIVAEEEIKERDVSKSCCLAFFFLPLLLLKFTFIKVTYECSAT